jgi:hypothetical protein
VPNLVPIKKREGRRRPPWIGCKLCLDLSEIFLVCILFCVGTKSEIFLLVFVALVWSVLLAACLNFLKQFHSGVISRRPSTCALRPDLVLFWSRARVVCFVFSRRAPPCPYFLFAGSDFFSRRAAPRQGSVPPRARVSRVCSSSAPARSSAPPSVFLFFPATAVVRVSLPMDLPSCSPWVDFHSTRCLAPPPSGFGFC